MLRDLRLKAVYRSDEDNILEDFYLPALSVGVSYQRAVGYFSGAMLSYAAQGISALVQNNGSMQLIIGGEISASDERAIREGYDTRELSERIGLDLLKTMGSIADALCVRRLETLSWLVASGRLDIKLALRRRGMYHEKIGIITDGRGDSVVFQGSANETVQALLPDFNFESINVFPSWHEGVSAHALPYVRGFKRLWENKTRDTWVLDFPEAARRKLVKIAANCEFLRPEVEVLLWNPDQGMGGGAGSEDAAPAVPKVLGGSAFKVRPHQAKALAEWKGNNFRGILAHATGSGKTITAAYGALRLFEAMKRLAIVVAVPYQNLADQWVRELSTFNLTAVRCYGSREAWEAKLTEQASLFRAEALPVLCIVVVNRTLQSPEFQRQLADIPGDRLMWVGDECHHHSSVGLATCLPQAAKMRLGLSATPEHYIDDQATARMTAYYGEIVSTFSLEDALKAGVISPYDYHVKVVSLGGDEAENYLELSRKIVAMAAGRKALDTEGSGDDRLRALLMKRARLLGTAREKLVLLRADLEREEPQPLTLFYCGDGSTEDEDGSASMRHVDQVSKLLYDLGWKCAQFTARESREDRERLLNAFRVGEVDALVAIRCLDEGIDLPACRRAFLLASGRNPRQSIQRRGRILRRAPGKEFATIVDMVVRLPSGQLERSPFERSLLVAEMERVAEFARLARNTGEVIGELMPLLREYDLAHLLI